MIDAKAFGEELAGIVKATTAPLLARIEVLERAIADRSEPPPGRDGHDGESVTIDDVMPALEKRVQDYLDALPRPDNGKDGERGKDGVGLAGALIDRDGCLVVTLSNGETKSLGRVVGEAGKDGQNGLGFDDMTLDYDGERTFTFLFQKGERIEERQFTVPVVLDRGVYRSESVYGKGDAVSYGGSLWIAQRETKARPDGSSDWRLSVKSGRDGRDGVVKAERKPDPVRVGGRNAG